VLSRIIGAGGVLFGWVLLHAAVGCVDAAAPKVGPSSTEPTSTKPSALAPSATVAAPASSAVATAAAAANTGTASGPAAVKPGNPFFTAERASELLFVTDAASQRKACSGDRKRVVACLLAARYAKDGKAAKLVSAIYRESGSVVGLLPKRRMDGGWRGMIDLVPQLPIGRHRVHVKYILTATRDFNRFFAALAAHSSKPLAFRHKPIAYKFFRSVGRTTPSAYARGWSVAYNVSGSLNRSLRQVRETLFHEVFHLNDRAHGDWSRKRLTPIYDAIVARCTKRKKLSTRCLAPYAPNRTMVRGGTYYAFQPGNGVWEYAAELAVRYFREQRAAIAKAKLAKKPFKCGPSENRQSWVLFAQEFFAGVDLVPPCP